MARGCRPHLSLATQIAEGDIALVPRLALQQTKAALIRNWDLIHTVQISLLFSPLTQAHCPISDPFLVCLYEKCESSQQAMDKMAAIAHGTPDSVALQSVSLCGTN
jgi:hypothetical protein